MRNAPAPEYAVVLAAARRLGRPVRWIETRSEAFLADPQAREQIADATFALDAEGRFVALDVQITAAMGAFVGPSTLHASFGNLPSLCGVYKIPVAFAHVEGLHRNTQTVAAYRGAGRPEASYIIERLIDIAASRLGLDKIALRRKNMLQSIDLPHETSLDYTYDSGDFPGLMDAALTAADCAGFEARRAQAAMRGQLRGLGIACTIEIAGGPTAHQPPNMGDWNRHHGAASCTWARAILGKDSARPLSPSWQISLDCHPVRSVLSRVPPMMWRGERAPLALAARLRREQCCTK